MVLIDVNGRFSPSFLIFEDHDEDEDEGSNNEQVRKEVGAFGAGVSAEEMLGERSRREEVVRAKGWRGMGDRGGEVVWRLD